MRMVEVLLTDRVTASNHLTFVGLAFGGLAADDADAINYKFRKNQSWRFPWCRAYCCCNRQGARIAGSSICRRQLKSMLCGE